MSIEAMRVYSHGSTDTLTASKALSRPLQSTSTQLACNREFISTIKALSSAKGPKFGQCHVYLQKELSTRKNAVTDNC
jgi:hypothetical protein